MPFVPVDLRAVAESLSITALTETNYIADIGSASGFAPTAATFMDPVARANRLRPSEGIRP